MNGPREHRADQNPQRTRQIPILRRQHGPNQRSGSGNRRKMVAEEHVLVGRVIVMPVTKLMRGRRTPRVQHRHFGSQERRIISISQYAAGMDECQRAGRRRVGGGGVEGVERDLWRDPYSVLALSDVPAHSPI
jgi:hypothetical protein